MSQPDEIIASLTSQLGECLICQTCLILQAYTKPARQAGSSS